MTLDAILGSRNRVRVLRVLFRQDGVSGRRVAALARVSPSACKATLEELAAIGLVLRTKERGRTLHELNRTHRLVAGLQHLYDEEARLPGRIAGSVRAVLAELRPGPELLCVGISEAGEAMLAVSRPEGCGEVLPALLNVLRFEFGLALSRLVEHPKDIPTTERLWVLPSVGGQGTVSARDVDRALRFFGVSKPARPGPAGDFHARGIGDVE